MAPVADSTGPNGPGDGAVRVAVWNDMRWVARTPMLVAAFAEYANAGQLWRMWHVHSALGQSLGSWISVHLTLWLWLNFDRLVVPGGTRSWAFRATAVGLILNSAVIATVAYFQATGRA